MSIPSVLLVWHSPDIPKPKRTAVGGGAPSSEVHRFLIHARASGFLKFTATAVTVDVVELAFAKWSELFGIDKVEIFDRKGEPAGSQIHVKTLTKG